MGLRKVNRVGEKDNLSENDITSRNTPSEHSVSQKYGTGEFTTETKATASTQMETDNNDVKRQSVASDCDADDASVSSSTSEGAYASEHNPKTPPPRPPKPSRPLSTASTTSTRTDSELKGDFKTKILGTSSSPLRDLTRKTKPKPSGPEQLDFRGQLKKTGLRADKDLSAQGRRQQQFLEGDIRRQLKTTGVDASRNLSALRNAGKKKGGVEQVDFRRQLNKTQGSESPLDKKAPTRPPPTYLTKKAVTSALASQPPAKTQTTEAKEDVKTADVKEGRKISSADLLNMVHKPVETSKESFLVQRGIKKAEASKSAAPKFIAPASSGTSDESFQAQMARRKERSEKLILSAKDQSQRKMSNGDETKDFRAVLKKAAAHKSRVMQKRIDLDTEEQPSNGEIKQ